MLRSLFWKILLSTSVALTLLFGITAWIVQDHVLFIATQELQEEVRASLRAYESIWRGRADKLAAISLVLSRMSDVRAAFGTGDRMTIRDTASEVWDKIPQGGSLFLVTDPRGEVIACQGGDCSAFRQRLSAIEQVRSKFPGQVSGFLDQSARLYQIVITPVYVAGGLLNILVAGYAVDETVARQLREATGGSDFTFLTHGRIISSTSASTPDRNDAVLIQPLLDVSGQPIGELRIVRSAGAARSRLAGLRYYMLLVILVALTAGLALSSWLARRILRPVKDLDRAAAEIGKGNYDAAVEVQSNDELGRLASTFNGMRESLRAARQELIRQERISTIGRLTTSIVHDLRNPLAAIYGGAEMLVDDDLSSGQVKRLANNIYRSSRRVQELLTDLVDLTRGRTQAPEACHLTDVVCAGIEPFLAAAHTQGVSIESDMPADIETRVERSRMERVFGNLVSNALEAMPDGGAIKITAQRDTRSIVVKIQDNGPGIESTIAASLFQPFTTSGKKNGLGLGLALSRQTLLDHGGDLWVESKPGHGATFFVRIPA